MLYTIHSCAWLYRSLLCSLLLFPVLGTAEESVDSTAKTLSLAQVFSRVLLNNPELAGFSYQQRVADARILQAGLRPNPELSLDVENMAGDNAYSGTDSAESTLAISQVMEMGSKRQHRLAVARIGSEVLQREYELATLEVLAKSASLFLDVAQAQQQFALVQQAADWSKNAEAAAQMRFKAGSASRAELSQARIESLRAQLLINDAQNNLQRSKTALAAQWAAEQADFSGVQADIFRLSTVPGFHELRARLDQSPQMSRYLTLSRLRQAELDLVTAQKRQDITLGLGLRRFEATGEQALTFQFSMPLGTSNRNQGEIAAARAELERVDNDKTVSRLFLFNDLHRLYQQLQQARFAMDLLKQQALPEAEQALTQTEQGYRNGRFSYLQLIETRRQRLTIESDAINAAVEFHRTLLSLEQLTGESLTVSDQTIIQPKQPTLGTQEEQL